MNAIEKITNYITRLENKDDLQTIAHAIQKRLAELEKQKGILKLTLIDGVWYALGVEAEDGKKPGITLGRQLSLAESLKQAREPRPTMQQFELLPKEAKAYRDRDPSCVGWWYDNGSHVPKFYHIPRFDEANGKWKRQNELAHDPVAMAYRLSVEGMEKLKRLENEGYKIDYPEDGY